jgi:hypothetical protein
MGHETRFGCKIPHPPPFYNAGSNGGSPILLFREAGT